jgi:hypothetical protein|nr:MAG TPA: hypothetical protein [Caudoviricetes sp.]
MQRSKLVDSLHFLVDPIYKGLDMSGFTAMMEYILPVSREYHSEILVKSDALYKEKLEYKVPFDTNLTKEAGNVEVQLTFVKVSLDADGENIQQVRKTSPTIIKILPISAWSDIVADNALGAIDQRLIQAEAMIQAVGEMAQYIDENKADNITYNEEDNYIQLTANGNPIGDKIVLKSIGVNVVSIQVNEDGELIVNYSDGTSKNIGKVGGECAGIYVPSYSEDGILTFTLSNKAGEPSYSFDVDSSNDWNPVGDEKTTYIWNKL